MSGYVVDVADLSVAYRIYPRPIDQLKELFLGGIRHETFWALNNVSLSISEGERVGIVGPNGAGKSTLLKAIAGTIQPTAGRVVTHGRISSLLSMVPAWNEEETGIENIRFNLLLQGVAERQIPRLVDDIADFTELGPFLFNPVKTYSTGMGARLAFGIATATEPDILIIDEVLGTGDGYFAWKAMKRMEEFCAKGRAMILVSHSMAAVQSMCNRVVWMQNGEKRLDGPAGDVLASYELDFRRAEDESLRAQHGNRLPTNDPALGELTTTGDLRLRIVPETGATFYARHLVREIGVRIGGGERIVVPLELVDPSGSAPAFLDALHSEWLRLHERGGQVGRVLGRVPGRHFGGQFVVRSGGNGALRGGVEVDVTLHSDDCREALRIDMLDMATSQWVPLTAEASRPAGDWTMLAFRGEIASVEREVMEAAVARAAAAALPDAEILSVKVMAGGTEVASVLERQPFEVQVRAVFNRPLDLADVGMKITRADGTYVFWQSSGQEGCNLVEPQGERTVRFRFDPNLLGAGEYFVNVHLTNGWRYPENYPYSRVFARKINAVAFRVDPELRGVDMGVLNQRAEVIVE